MPQQTPFKEHKSLSDLTATVKPIIVRDGNEEVAVWEAKITDDGDTWATRADTKIGALQQATNILEDDATSGDD